MMNATDFLMYVIRPTLEYLALPGGRSAEVLLLGTALTESRLIYLDQRGNDTLGPAVGVFQMEKLTYDDHWQWLLRKPRIALKVAGLVSAHPTLRFHQMVGNLPYACAMARVHYYRKPDPLPPWDDPMALALYHKKHYNTTLGKADPQKSKRWFQAAMEVAAK